MHQYRKLVVVLVAFLFLVACKKSNSYNSYHFKKFNDKVRYVAVQSYMMNKNGRIITMNEKGNILEEMSIPLQDIQNISIKNSNIYFSGARSNNNVIINKDGRMDVFHLLDNSNYTGSTSILMSDGISYSSMNGNVDEKDGYVSLLVARDIYTKKTLFKTIVPLFTTSMCEDEKYIYLVGTNSGLKDKEEAVLILLDKKTGTIENKYLYPEYREFFDIRKKDDRIFLSATDKKSLNTEIYEFKNDNVLSLNNKATGRLLELSEDTIVYSSEKGVYFSDYNGKIKKELEFQSNYFLLNSFVEKNVIYLFLEIDSSAQTKYIDVYQYDMKKLNLIDKLTIPIDNNSGDTTIIAPVLVSNN